MSTLAPSIDVQVKSVLIATDFSLASERALCHATAVARLYEAVIAARGSDPAKSRTARLLRAGRAKMAKKLAEEAIEVVIDAMNPLDFSGGFPPKLSICGEDSLGERVQRALPDAKVVKAFNTIGNPYFVDPSFSEGQPTMLIAGDDEGAKHTVGDVLADFGWSDVVDIGGIEGSRELEAICIVWVKIGGTRGSWDHGFKLLVG